MLYITIFGFIEALSQTSISLALDQRVAIELHCKVLCSLEISMQGNHASRYSQRFRLCISLYFSYTHHEELLVEAVLHYSICRLDTR